MIVKGMGKCVFRMIPLTYIPLTFLPVFPSAILPVVAAWRAALPPAGLETRDTADLEVCATLIRYLSAIRARLHPVVHSARSQGISHAFGWSGFCGRDFCAPLPERREQNSAQTWFDGQAVAFSAEG
jgi:hypothetical protein